MSSAPSQPRQGALLHRLCPMCDLEILEDVKTCAECGTKLIEVRDEIDTVVGTVVDGRFEIRAKLGQGGMGTVYKAWQKSIGREVAVKVLDRSFSRDAMAVRRFLREARLASQLSQPNTVSVFEFGQIDDGRLFIAMELIRGKTLHEVVQRDGAFSTERTVRIGIQICDALEAAHGIGIVHRDLKLENVIVLDHPPGRDLLKVLDFGLAKNLRDPGSRATESGIVVGTPRYMSPESSMAGVTGPPGDLYSLGVILGELATGTPLWKGDTLPELITQKLDPAPIIARLPLGVRGVIGKLLQPEPEKRPTAEQTRMLLLALSGTSLAGTTSATVPFASAPSITPPGGTPTLTPSDIASAKTEASQPGAKALERARAETPTSDGKARGPASAPPASSDSTATSTAAPASTTSQVRLQPAPRKWPLVLVGAGAFAAVAVTIALALNKGDDRGAPRAVSTPPVDAAAVALAADAAIAEPPVDAAVAPVAAAPERVTIHVDSQPRGAAVTYLGTTKTAPFDVEVERGTKAIELRAVLAGRHAKKVTFVPDDNKTVVIKLAPATKSDEETPF